MKIGLNVSSLISNHDDPEIFHSEIFHAHIVGDAKLSGNINKRLTSRTPKLNLAQRKIRGQDP